MRSTPVSTALQNSSVPKREQLRVILSEMATTELSPGDVMPSERALMEEYGVSRITVREAIGQLVSEGRLVRVRGKGTFVAHQPVRSTLHLASFTEEMTALGRSPLTIVLRKEELVPDPDTAQSLGSAEGETAFHVRRLRLADGAPVSVDDAWYRASAVPGLLDLDLSASIYEALAGRFGSPIERATQTVSAEAASEEIATLLGVSAGAPVLVFDRVSFAASGPIERTRSWYRSDRYRVQMEVASRPAGE